MDSADYFQRTDTKDRIKAALAQYGPLSVRAIVYHTQKDASVIRTALYQMSKRGLIRHVSWGVWTLAEKD